MIRGPSMKEKGDTYEEMFLFCVQGKSFKGVP